MDACNPTYLLCYHKNQLLEVGLNSLVDSTIYFHLDSRNFSQAAFYFSIPREAVTITNIVIDMQFLQTSHSDSRHHEHKNQTKYPFFL